ncbi:MAG: substrate-binding domain-containing protein [Pseudomonadota bacterium]
MANKEIRVAILIDTLDDYFQRALVGCFNAASQSSGFQLFFIPGHIAKATTNFERQFNILFGFGRSHQFDAVISATEHFQHHLSHDECIQFLGQYAPIPLVNLNFSMAGTSSVLIDNRAGFRPLMQHLIQDHQYKRFAFMKGIASTKDAEDRFDEFLRCLAESGIAFDPELAVTGNFNQAEGRVAMARLLDKKIPFDVLVCANDGMAHAAIAVAVERGLRVPQDVAVTGFDDVLAFAKQGLPLTTVGQPFQALVDAAFALVRERVELKRAPSVVSVPTRAIIRQTCGCIVVDKKPRPLPAVQSSHTETGDLLDGLNIVPEQADMYRAHADRLLEALKRDEESFLSALSEIANATLAETGVLGQLQDLLMALHHHASTHPSAFVQPLPLLGKTLLRGQIVLTNAQNVYNVRVKLLEGSSEFDLQDLGFLKRHMSGFDRDAMLDLIEAAMVRLSIPTVYLVLYTDPVVLRDAFVDRLPAQSQLIFATNNYVRQREGLHVPFPTVDILPVDVFARSGHQSLALFPLFQYSEHYGYLILDITTLPPYRIELVREEINSSLVGSILVSEVSTARDLLKSDLVVSEGHNVRLVDQVIKLNRRLQALFDSALEVAIIATDTEGNIDVFNSGAEKMLGYHADEVMGISPALFHVPGEMRTRSLELSAQHGRVVEGFEVFVANTLDGQSEIKNWTYVQKDGKHIQVSLAVSAVHGGDGAVIGFLGIARDITVQIEAESKLRALNQQLDLRVQQRTQSLAESTERLTASLSQLKLTQSKLVQSEKLAALGSIVSAVAHELNTPLGNSVTVASTMQSDVTALAAEVETGGLRRSRLDSYLAATHEGMELLIRSLTRAAGLVENFKQIAVSQSQASRMVFDLKDVLGTALNLAIRKSGDCNVEVDLNVPADLMMDGYPDSLVTVIDSLVKNSLLHGFEGRSDGRISIKASLQASTIAIVYKDNGVGMPEQVVKHVFDPFFTTKFGKGGNGLGMFICHNQVTGPLGGTIDVHSAPGAGCTVTIHIPVSAPRQG